MGGKSNITKALADMAKFRGEGFRRCVDGSRVDMAPVLSKVAGDVTRDMVALLGEFATDTSTGPSRRVRRHEINAMGGAKRFRKGGNFRGG